MSKDDPNDENVEAMDTNENSVINLFFINNIYSFICGGTNGVQTTEKRNHEQKWRRWNEQTKIRNFN